MSPISHSMQYFVRLQWRLRITRKSTDRGMRGTKPSENTGMHTRRSSPQRVNRLPTQTSCRHVDYLRHRSYTLRCGAGAPHQDGVMMRYMVFATVSPEGALIVSLQTPENSLPFADSVPVAEI